VQRSFHSTVLTMAMALLCRPQDASMLTIRSAGRDPTSQVEGQLATAH